MPIHKITKRRPLRVGTDCSGIEAPIQALLNLEIPFKHKWACDIDKYVRQSIEANYSPEILFEDILKRDVHSLPDIDLYVCGFPCQSFSMAGARKGLEDPRGNIFYACLEVLLVKQPRYFIMENVRGLLSIHGGELFPAMIEALEEVGYNVAWDVMNTRNYGVPQNRERVYILGIHRSVKSTFTFPQPEPEALEDIRDYIDWSNTVSELLPKYISERGYMKKIPRDAIFLDFRAYRPTRTLPNAHRWLSCIMTRGDYWNVTLQRRATVKELLMLQGFPPDFKQVVSNTQLKKQIGNSMSVNVVEVILQKLLL